jgi:putative flippase GtrA
MTQLSSPNPDRLVHIAPTATPVRPAGRRERGRVIYLVSTGLVIAVMVFSIFNFVFNDHFPFPNGKEGAFEHLHLPYYFKIELTIAKILGVLALVLPGVPHKIREFAYFGFGITLISAAIAHYSVGDAALGFYYILDPLLFFVALVVSYRYFLRFSRH